MIDWVAFIDGSICREIEIQISTRGGNCFIEGVELFFCWSLKYGLEIPNFHASSVGWSAYLMAASEWPYCEAITHSFGVLTVVAFHGLLLISWTQGLHLTKNVG